MDFKAEREKRQWSTQQVADKIGWKVATINGLEKHGTGSKRLIKAMEKLFGYSAAELHDRPDAPAYLVDELLANAQEIIERARSIERVTKKLRASSTESAAGAGAKRIWEAAKNAVAAEQAGGEPGQPLPTSMPYDSEHPAGKGRPRSGSPSKKPI